MFEKNSLMFYSDTNGNVFIEKQGDSNFVE